MGAAETIDLKACPFCGENTAFDESHKPDCYFRVSQQLIDDADVQGSLSEVYDAWNRRAHAELLESMLVNVEQQRDSLLNCMRRIVALDCHPTDSQTIRAYLHSECILEAKQALREMEAANGGG